MYKSILIILIVLLLGTSSTIAQDNDLPKKADTSTIYLPIFSTGAQDTQVVGSTTEVVQEWISYDYPNFGLTIYYPAGWHVEAPNFDALLKRPEGIPADYQHDVNLNYAQSVGHSLTLVAPATGELAATEIVVAFESYTLSHDNDLRTYAELSAALSNIEYPFASKPQFYEVNDSALTLPEKADQIILMATESEHGFGEIIYIRRDELVYSVRSYSRDSKVHEIMIAIAGQLSLPDEELTKQLRQSTPFNGDEHFLKQQIEGLQPVPEPDCDIRCQDQKAYTEEISTDQQEAANENMGGAINAASAEALMVSANRKALPANWLTPVYPPSSINLWDVACGSSFHTGNAEFAVDAGVPSGTPVYAAYDGVVTTSSLQTDCYGELVLIRTSSINMAAESRTYYHAYAHLSSRNVTVGQTVSRGTLIGSSGNSKGASCTSSIPAHLHFHIRDSSNNPVDATPVKGFTPNLNYPSVFASCGVIEKYNVAPTVIEPVAFTERYQPRSNHNWYCLNTVAGATNECYLEATPNNGTNLDPMVASQSPELRYNNVYLLPPSNPTIHYVWICARGDNGNDDSLNMGAGGTPLSTLYQIQKFNTATWVWKSERFGGARPLVSAGLGNSILNVWMREDGIRIGRILLTTDINYNPSGKIRCGAY